MKLRARNLMIAASAHEPDHTVINVWHSGKRHWLAVPNRELHALTSLLIDFMQQHETGDPQ